jgi:hypothetical protein
MNDCLVFFTELPDDKTAGFLHCNENPVYVFLFWELRGPNFHIHVSLGDLYFPRFGPHISCSRIDRPILEIYTSLSDIYVHVGTGRQNIIILFWK